MKRSLLESGKFKLGGFAFTFNGNYWAAEKEGKIINISDPKLSYSSVVRVYDGDRLVKEYPNPQSLQAYSMMILLEATVFNFL